MQLPTSFSTLLPNNLIILNRLYSFIFFLLSLHYSLYSSCCPFFFPWFYHFRLNPDHYVLDIRLHFSFFFPNPNAFLSSTSHQLRNPKTDVFVLLNPYCRPYTSLTALSVCSKHNGVTVRVCIFNLKNHWQTSMKFITETPVTFKRAISFWTVQEKNNF